MPVDWAQVERIDGVLWFPPGAPDLQDEIAELRFYYRVGGCVVGCAGDR